MKKQLLAVALGLTLLTACQSGSKRLARSWDDSVNQQYSESSRLHGALFQDVLPVYPTVGSFAAVGDILFVNTYYFWTKDAWDGDGTSFTHKQVEGAEKLVSGPGF